MPKVKYTWKFRDSGLIKDLLLCNGLHCESTKEGPNLHSVNIVDVGLRSSTPISENTREAIKNQEDAAGSWYVEAAADHVSEI